MSFRFLCLAAVFILTLGLAFLVRKWPQGRRATFSQHAAAYKHTILYYILLFSIVLPLLLLFFVGWFAPTFHLLAWFDVFIVISSVMQYGCTFVPEVGGWKTKVHQALAGLSAVCLLPPMVLLLVSDFIRPADKVVVFAGLLVMAAIICALFFGKKKSQPLLLFQAGYFTAFFVPMLAISYL